MHLTAFRGRALRANDSDSNGAPSSPVKGLSDELLTAIVLQLVQDFKETEEDAFCISSKHPLITASHVSRDWRGVVLSSPLLWNEIHVVTPSIPPFHDPEDSDSEDPYLEAEDLQRQWIHQMRCLPDIALTWIERSQHCALSINMHLGYYLVPRANNSRALGEIIWETYAVLINTICDVVGRWRELSVEIPLQGSSARFDASLSRLRNLSSLHVPLLEKVHLSLSVNGYLNHLAPPMDGIQMGSAVRSLHIPAIRCLWQDYYANWSVLTELHVEGFASASGRSEQETIFDPREALSLLKACPRLVACLLRLNVGRDFEGVQHPGFGPNAVTMPALEVLTLDGNCLWPSFANSLVLPALRELDLFSMDMEEGTLKHWLSRFGRGLASARLEIKVDIATVELEHILDRVPNVKSLSLNNYASLMVVEDNEDEEGGGQAKVQIDIAARVLSALTLKRTLEGDLE